MNFQSSLPTLIKQAKKAYSLAFAPYSNFKVGAALLTEDGNIYSGCNVEFADYLVLHAELNAIGSAVTSGETSFVAMVIYSNREPPVLPCGSCRQKIYEFSALHNTDIRVIAINNNTQISSSIKTLLPDADIFN